MRKFELSDKNFERIGFILVVGIIAFFTFFHFDKINGLFVMNDEFGYWSIAASLAGLDWKDSISYCAYYSYGYSLTLVPLFWIFEETITMYKCAVILNGLYIILAYLLMQKTAKKLFPSYSKKVIVIASLVAVLYSSNLAYIQIAWCELWLMLWFCILTYSLVSFLKSRKLSFLIMTCIATCYIYTIHQRALSIVISVVIWFIVYFITNKGTAKEIGCSILIFGAMFFLHGLMKDYSQNYIWTSDAYGLNFNDYDSVLGGFLGTLSSWKGILSLFFSYMQKLFYAFSASFSLVVWVFVYFVKNTFEVNKETKKVRVQKENGLLLLFFFLTFALSVGVTTAFMANYYELERWDVVVYGRYTEYIMPVFMLVGMLALLDNFKWDILHTVYAIGSFILCLFVYMYKANKVIFLHQNAVSFLAFLEMTSELEWFPFLAYFIPLLGLIVVCIINKVFSKKVAFIVFALMIGGFGICNGYIMHMHIQNAQKGDEKYENFSEWIENFDDADVYVFRPDKGVVDGLNQVQFSIEDKMVDIILFEESQEIIEAKKANGIYVFPATDLRYYEMLDDYYVGFSESGLIALVSNNGNIAMQMEEKQIPYLSDENGININLANVNSDIGRSQNNTLVSSGETGYLCWGNYQKYSAGEYMFSFDIELNGELGAGFKVDINSENGVLSSIKVTEAFDDNNITIPIILGEEAEYLELRVYCYEGCKITLNKVQCLMIHDGIELPLNNFQSDVGVLEKNALISNGQEGYLCWGNYKNLQKGNYDVLIDWSSNQKK